jgi:hypothetical protein
MFAHDRAQSKHQCHSALPESRATSTPQYGSLSLGGGPSVVPGAYDDEPVRTWPTALQPQVTVPATILPTSEPRLFVTFGRPTPQDPTVDPQAFRAAIIELTDALHEPIAREGFEIAAELYGGVDFEPSEAGRLLRLWTILECLAERTRRSPVVQETVDRWRNEVDELPATGNLDTTEAAMIKAFLDNARTQSINAAVADLVDRYAGDSREAMRTARGVRNSLIHGNAVRQDLGHAVYDLRSITRQVIAGVIRDWIGAHPAPRRATEPS